MAFGNDRRAMASGRTADVIDEGLRQHMLRVYNYMASGLALTGIVAFVAASLSVVTNQAGEITGLTQLGISLFVSPLKWVVMLAPLGFIFFLGARLQRMSFGTAQTVFWVFAGVMGLSFATIFISFTGASIAKVFFITAGTFAGMSLYGYTTRRDLTGWGSFLIMGLIGVIIAMVVNMFLQSPALEFAISVIGVLVFVGLTAYDTQKIKEMYAEADDAETLGKKAIMGALRLYLDFINLFIILLHLFGQRR